MNWDKILKVSDKDTGPEDPNFYMNVMEEIEYSLNFIKADLEKFYNKGMPLRAKKALTEEQFLDLINKEISRILRKAATASGIGTGLPAQDYKDVKGDWEQ